MRLTLYIRRVPGSQNELGSIWTQIATIAGATAGQTAQAFGLPTWAQGLIGAGGQIAAGLLNRPPETGPLTDDGEISAAIDAMAAQYHQAEAAGATVEQLLQLATAILSALNSPQYFGTPRHTGGAAYLASARTSFGRTVSLLQGQMQQPAGPTQPGTIIPGQTTPGTIAPPQTAIGSMAIGGIPLQTVLIFAGGGLLIWVLLK